ncbi:Gfo/Idh/MocA family oxidoreductase [Georgenia sp. AZ-5]|uniref:Gfo/Idh/MocA family oxidoreductase n=1 Tax=Georgenia sp. AZ-5 TaxID=3367526 RepID=UPI0037543A79
MTERLGLAIVGLGLAGGGMLAAARTHPGVRLAAAVDPQPELRARFAAAEGLPAFADLGDALALDDVDAVYIASPHQFHREQAVRAAQAGKHVVVEKPMALTLEDCDAMVTAAEAAGVVLIVGHTHGFAPGVLLLRELVQSGRYGPLGMIALWNYTDFLYRPRRPEELDTSAGGGILFNQVPHQVDIARTIAGSPVRAVTALTSVLDPQRPTEGSCAALVELESGAAVNLVYSGYDHFDSDELHGWIAEGGGPKTPAHGAARARLRGLSANEERQERTTRMAYGARTVARPENQPHFGELVVSCAGADLRLGRHSVLAYTDDGVVEHPIDQTAWWPGRGDVLEELVTAVRHRSPALHDGEFGRDTLAVCLAIIRSADQRRQVLLDSRRERCDVPPDHGTTRRQGASDHDLARAGSAPRSGEHPLTRARAPQR